MRILHFSDIHYWKIQLGPDPYYPKRFLGLMNLIFSRKNHFPAPLADTVVNALAQEKADAVLFSGDLTTTSLESEFKKASDAFAPLYKKWNDQLIVIPGNHDRYTPMSVRSMLYEKYFSNAFAGTEKRVFSKPLNDHLCVIGFDASRPFMVRSNGMLTKTLVEELDQEFSRVKKTYNNVILMGHFPYSYPANVPSKFHHKLIGEDLLKELISKHNPIAYLHGHKHVRWCLKAPATRDTLCLNAGPAGMSSTEPNKHAGWIIFDVDDSGEITEVIKVHLSSEGQPIRETVELSEL